MSCDLSDPAITVAYDEITSGQPTNWLILGYNDTRDVISLYTKGTGGLSELILNLREEVLYGFVRIDERYILITYVSEQVSGVRRARALVHGRAVGALFKAHNAQITASSAADLSDINVRNRLKLAGDSPRSSMSEKIPTTPNSSRPQSPISPRPLSPSSSRRRQGSVPSTPTTAVPAVPSPPQSPSIEPPVYIGNGSNGDEKHSPEPAVSRSIEDAKKRADVERLRKTREAERLAALQSEEADKAAAALIAKQEAQRIAIEAEERAIIEKQEAEKRAKEEAERLHTETLKRQFLEAEKSGKGSSLSGFITVQGGTTQFWKRRWFAVKSKNMFLYRDQADKLPIASLDLSTASLDLDNENLMPNSFALTFGKTNETYEFFSDNRQEHQAMITLLRTI